MIKNSSDFFERLEELKKLSQAKKYRLTNIEHDESIKVLLNLIETDQSSLDKVMNYLSGFPSDVGAQVLSKNWSVIREIKYPIFQKLRDKKFSNELGKRLRLALGKSLIEQSPSDALHMLVSITRDMRLANKDIPSMKSLKLIRSTLFKTGSYWLNSLPVSSNVEIDIQALMIYLLAAGFLDVKKGKPISPPEVQLNLLRWTKNFSVMPRIPNDLELSIKSTIRSWKSEYKKVLLAEKELMHSEIRIIIEDAFGKIISTDPPPESIGQIPPKSNLETKKVSTNYDAFFEIGRLAEYIKQQRESAKHTTQDLLYVKEELNISRDKTRLLQKEIEGLNNQLKNNTENEVSLTVKLADLKKVNEGLTSELFDTKHNLRCSTELHKSELKSLEHQLDVMSERISKEGGHRLNIFRNKIKGRLKNFGKILEDVENMETSDDLCRLLRTQLKQMIKTLKSEGIDINGGK